MKPLIVLDTNVLISALMNSRSASQQAVTTAFRAFQPVFSHDTWREIEEVSDRKKFARWYSPDDRLSFLFMLAQAARFELVTLTVTDCTDPKDNKFLALAVSCGCQLIVSGDVDLKSMHPYRGIAIASPRAFLDAMSDAK